MNTSEKMNELGLIGEKIVINYLSSIGCKIEQSIDKYDSTKDLIADNKTVEVKTQVPFIMENALTFLPSQLKKCKNVDRLFFVTVPANSKEYKWSGWLFEVDPKNFKTREKITKDGRKMILVNIEQEAVTPIHELKSDYIKELKRYKVSDY